MSDKYKIWIQPKGSEQHFCDSGEDWIEFPRVQEDMTRLLKGPSSGFWQRVWIVDTLDCCVLDWRADKGIVFPTEDDIKNMKDGEIKQRI